MIVELLVGAGLVAFGAATARVIARRRAARAPDLPKEGKKDAADEVAPGPRGLRVGDVLLYADSEYWLAGMVELDEEGLAARIFATPGAARASWVAQLDEQAQDLVLLSETSEVPAGPVPEALPVGGGRRVSLERRGHADARSEGEHLPRTTARAAYAILADAGGRVLIVIDFEKAPRLALLGDRVSRQSIDLLPGGDLEAKDR